MMETCPICFKKQQNNKIWIHANSFVGGHTLISWNKASDPSRVQMKPMTKEDLVIDGFDESDDYAFRTSNSKEVSDDITVHFNALTSDELIDQIISYIPSFEDEEYADDEIGKLREKMSAGTDESPLSILVRQYRETESLQEHEIKTYRILLRAFERYACLQDIFANKDALGNTSISFTPLLKIIPGTGVTTLKIYRIEKDGSARLHRTENIVAKDEATVILTPDTLSLISVYADDELVMQFEHYQPDERMLAIEWRLEKDALDDELEAMQQDLKYEHSGVEMTPEEVSWAAAERQKAPLDYISSRPSPSYVKNFINYFYIDTYPLLVALQKKFYLAAKEADLLFSVDYDRTSLITDSGYVGINLASNYLGGNILFYLTDDSHRPLSRFMRMSDENDMSDYNAKVRLVEIEAYRKRIASVMKVKAPSVAEDINQIIEEAKTDPTITPETVWMHLIKEIARRQSQFPDAFKLYYAIAEEMNSNFTVDKKFFKEYVTYDHSTEMFTFSTTLDPAHSYALCVHSFDRYDDEFYSEYFPSFNTSVDYLANSRDYYIMYAINATNYRRSGFLLACTIDGCLIASDNLEVVRR